MANIFLDANYFIGILTKRENISLEELSGHQLFISPISIHIYYYINKIKVPDEQTELLLEDYSVTDLNSDVMMQSQTGPTVDLEDNIQLHSAVLTDCDYFLVIIF
jgi:hypothetical protein